MGVNSTMVLVKSEFLATTNSSSFIKISDKCPEQAADEF